MKKLLLSSFMVLGCLGVAFAQKRASEPVKKQPKKAYVKQDPKQKAIADKKIAAQQVAATRQNSVMMEKASLPASGKTN